MTCCDRPRGNDRTVCRACQATTRRRLGDLGGYLHAELEVTLMRADRTTTSPHGKTVGKEQPLPFSERASRVVEAIHATLASWAMLIHDEAGAPLPADATSALVEHVVAWLPWLVKHDAGDELVHDVARLHRSALDAVDLIPRRRGCSSASVSASTARASCGRTSRGRPTSGRRSAARRAGRPTTQTRGDGWVSGCRRG